MKTMRKTGGAALLCAVIFLLGSCIVIEKPIYHVSYHGNGHTSGKAPVDRQAYEPGGWVVVMDGADLKKGDALFTGWRRRHWADVFDPGQGFTIYDNIDLYAVWSDEIPFKYKIENGEAIITGYDQNLFPYGEPLTIPDSIEGNPVTRIANNALKEKYISEITLPRDLEYIGTSAFSSNNLYEIIITGKVIEIGANAFQYNSISSLTLGDALEHIGSFAFRGNDLSNVFLPQGLVSIGQGAFHQNNITVIEIGSGVDIQSGTAMGGYGESFKTHYEAAGKAAGIYIYNQGAWKGPAN